MLVRNTNFFPLLVTYLCLAVSLINIGLMDNSVPGNEQMRDQFKRELNLVGCGCAIWKPV